MTTSTPDYRTAIHRARVRAPGVRASLRCSGPRLGTVCVRADLTVPYPRPAVPDDFIETTRRMRADGDLLYSEGRFKNAAYFAGYVVECSLKAIVEGHPRIQGAPSSFSHRLQDLTSAITSVRVTRRPRGFRFDSRKLADAFEWDPGGRYDAAAWGDEQAAVRIRKAADYADRTLQEFQLDGVVSSPS